MRQSFRLTRYLDIIFDLQKQFLAGQLSYGSTVNIHTQQGTFEGVVDCIDVKAGCVAIGFPIVP
eukprot:980488-Amorphochlora_amoeboformis.AAC.1